VVSNFRVKSTINKITENNIFEGMTYRFVQILSKNNLKKNLNLQKMFKSEQSQIIKQNVKPKYQTFKNIIYNFCNK